jgi:glutathione synthase/RimK-type ligase-like ATP-grasp enzyme
MAVLRSAWNYHQHYQPFVSWAHAVAQRTRLLNPLPLVVWNSDKRYLRMLEAQGIPIIPTIWFSQGSNYHLASFLLSTGWHKAILKPSIGANSSDVRLVTSETLAEGQAHLDHFLSQRRGMMLLQPYVEHEGEHSHVFLNSEWSHAFQRQPFGVRQAVDTLDEPQIVPCTQEIAFATAVIQTVQRLFRIPTLLYGRVDLIREQIAVGGSYRLMEVEIIEPMLHLEYANALSRFTDALVHALHEARSSKMTELPV